MRGERGRCKRRRETETDEVEGRMIKDQEREIGCVVNSVGRPVCFDRRSLTTLVPHKKEELCKRLCAWACFTGRKTCC